MVLQQAGSSPEKLQVCGLLPQWPGTLPALLGLGFRNFSVDPIMIPWLAQTVHQVNTKRASELAQKVCLAQTAREVKQFLFETGKE